MLVACDPAHVLLCGRMARDVFQCFLKFDQALCHPVSLYEYLSWQKSCRDIHCAFLLITEGKNFSRTTTPFTSLCPPACYTLLPSCPYFLLSFLLIYKTSLLNIPKKYAGTCRILSQTLLEKIKNIKIEGIKIVHKIWDIWTDLLIKEPPKNVQSCFLAQFFQNFHLLLYSIYQEYLF